MDPSPLNIIDISQIIKGNITDCFSFLAIWQVAEHRFVFPLYY